ncbi:MAG: ABC transporter permease [Candidatus Hydrogenedentes bacterium]|nr:ABC transporter permease [Candidatus Hydrogenedentota bacterium]
MNRFLAKHSPLLILAALCIVMAFLLPAFSTPRNVTSVVYRTSVVGIVAVGQLLVIIVGGIDLSVGSVAALSGVIAGLALRDYHTPVAVAIVLGSMTGLLCGAVNGLLVSKGRIPSFIATLGMMMAARGAALLLSKAQHITLDEGIRFLGGMRGWWIPVAITIAIAVVFAVILVFTRFGRSLYATGGNPTGARLSGVPVDRVRTGAFALCGLLAGFAGVMLGSRLGTADGTAAEGMELDSISACVMGGASLMGGEGGVAGSLAGALIMNVMVNFCNLKGYDSQWQKILIGALIVLLVLYDTSRKRKAGLLRD